MRFTRHYLLALMFGAGMTAVLPAQNPPRPRRAPAPPAGARQPAPAQARRAGGPAAMLINQREQLGLTEDQVKKLEALEAASKVKNIEPATMLRLRADLMDATKGEANLVAARAAYEKIYRAQTDVFIARLQARNQARAILTPEQQSKFDAMEARRPMQMPGMGGAMGGGMRGAMGGGMRGGRGAGMVDGMGGPPNGPPDGPRPGPAAGRMRNPRTPLPAPATPPAPLAV